MSLLMELVPCHRVESSVMPSHLDSDHKHEVNLSFELVHCHWHPRGVEDLLDLCVAHVLAALPFMYDRMNSIWLVLSGNSDPHRHMYRAALCLEAIEVNLADL